MPSKKPSTTQSAGSAKKTAARTPAKPQKTITTKAAATRKTTSERSAASKPKASKTAPTTTRKTTPKPAAKPAAKAPPPRPTKAAVVEQILSIGIDLGTSRSVVSAGNGRRQWIESYVGWPKDFITRKTLGNRVLFGAEALQHRLSLDLVRPLANGVIKEGTEREEEAVRELIGHLIELAEPEAEQRLHVAVGIPAEALKVNRNAIINAISDHAHKLMIVSEPFAVAYDLGALDNAMIIDIGAGTVDFCIMHGTMPRAEDQRSLVSAGDYVDQQLFDLLSERYPTAAFTLNMVRRFKEEYGFVGDARGKVEVDVPVQGKLTRHDITHELRRACESIMAPIVETIMDMIGKFDPEYQEQIRGNIILAGGGSQFLGIEEYLTEATRDFEPCTFRRVDDPLYVGADGALGLAQDAPDEYWEK